MIKLTFCLRRLPHISPGEFQTYWFENHGPLVRARAEVLRIKRYVQTHTMLDDAYNQLLRQARGGPEPYDGVAELWWDSLDDLARGNATPEGRRAGAELLEDEKKFIDLANSPLWFGDEHVVVG
ncbi:MAG: EthD domain-containing protein [Proteobacteria bacterium]|nr:EthD domain-containing protein [Pseudomonadota bacterium]